MKIDLPFIGPINIGFNKAEPKAAPTTDVKADTTPAATGHSTQDTFEPAGPRRNEGGFIRGSTSGGPTN